MLDFQADAKQLLSLVLLKMAQPTSSQALYNFRLLSALRSDDASQVQAFIDEAAGDPSLSGALLGTAVKVGTSEYRLYMSRARRDLPLIVSSHHQRHPRQTQNRYQRTR